MFTGIFYILLFFMLGEIASYLIGGFVPGGVLGMLLLFVALSTRIVAAEKVRDVSRILIKNMVFFFLPAAVGIITSYKLLGDHLWAILVASAVSTALIIAVVALIQQTMERRKHGNTH